MTAIERTWRAHSGAAGGCPAAPASRPGGAPAQAIQYERPVETAPQQKTIGGGYVTPDVQKPRPRRYWLQVLDVVLLAVAMGISRVAGAVPAQPEVGAGADGRLPGLLRLLPRGLHLPDRLHSERRGGAHRSADTRFPWSSRRSSSCRSLVALFFGRAFCGGVCPLGAIQELVVLKPVQVPRRLDNALGLLKYVYLGLAILLAVKPAICARLRHLPVRPVRRLLPPRGLRPHDG